MIRVNRVFVLVLIASLLFAFATGGTMPFYTFYFLLFLFITGYIYIFFQRYWVNAEVRLYENVFSAGDETECLTIVKGSIIIPVPFVVVKSLSIADTSDKCTGEMLNITREEDCWIRKKITFYKRGIYNLGKVDLMLKDMFHIFTLQKTVDCSVEAKVYPRAFDIKKLPLGGRDIYQRSIDIRSTNEDAFTIKDVRKYRTGDSLKKIHWKVSAKHGELYVKNSDNIFGEEFAIFIDMHKDNNLLDDSGEAEEAMVDLCVSMVSFMQQKDICSKVFINCSLPVCHDINTKEHFNNLMEFFLRQASNGNMDFAEYLCINFYKLQRNNRIAIITGKITDYLCTSISKIKNYGYSVTVFYSVEDEGSEKNLRSLNNIGVDCLKAR